MTRKKAKSPQQILKELKEGVDDCLIPDDGTPEELDENTEAILERRRQEREDKKENKKGKRDRIKDAPSIWENPDHTKDTDRVIHDQCKQVYRYAYLQGMRDIDIANYMGLDVEKHPAFSKQGYKLESGKIKKYYEAGRFQYMVMVADKLKERLDAGDTQATLNLMRALLQDFNNKITEEKLLREKNNQVQRVMIVNPIKEDKDGKVQE